MPAGAQQIVITVRQGAGGQLAPDRRLQRVKRARQDQRRHLAAHRLALLRAGLPRSPARANGQGGIAQRPLAIAGEGIRIILDVGRVGQGRGIMTLHRIPHPGVPRRGPGEQRLRQALRHGWVGGV